MNELADIVEPVQAMAPGSQDELIIATVLVLVICGLAMMRWWLQNKQRRRTLRRLRQLRRDVSAGRMTARELAYAIASELRSCLQTYRLPTAYPLLVRNELQHAAWCSFVARLDSLRYQPSSELDPAHVDALLREAAAWARRSR